MAGAARAQTAEPLLRPGWWWWDFGTDEANAFGSFQLANRGAFRTVTTWQTDTHAIVLFEVHAPLRWTLSGKPKRAPRGAKTTLVDMVKMPAPSPGFIVAVEEITGQSYDRVKRGAALGPGLIFWGGALALLAWNAMSGDDAPKKGGSE